jgi:hypothetical protein
MGEKKINEVGGATQRGSGSLEVSRKAAPPFL